MGCLLLPFLPREKRVSQGGLPPLKAVVKSKSKQNQIFNQLGLTCNEVSILPLDVWTGCSHCNLVLGIKESIMNTQRAGQVPYSTPSLTQ